MSETLVAAERVSKRFRVGGGVSRRELHALDTVDLDVRRNEILAIVGESGSGKTTLGRSLLGLASPTSGRVLFRGRDVARFGRDERRRFRRALQPVFQNPYSSLDPRWRVERIVREGLDAFSLGTPAERRARVTEVLEAVGLTERHARSRPHELSGGQRQRVAIAAALAPRPELIVADEPVSALDVLVQAQILNLIASLHRDFGLTLVLITHDLDVVAHLADRVAVMYLGRIVESGSAADVLERPAHPYTRALVASSVHTHRTPGAERARLGGEIPSAVDPPRGCHLHLRCPLAMDVCRGVVPALEPRPDGRLVACHAVSAGETGPHTDPTKEEPHADR
ncbi:MAG TPA: ABC transporter ATP-binding protein [Gaiellaceae bacterium]|nr:ABC transporter ATP-binding protein [Gaiellaceae bacterium]